MFSPLHSTKCPQIHPRLTHSVVDLQSIELALDRGGGASAQQPKSQPLHLGFAKHFPPSLPCLPSGRQTIVCCGRVHHVGSGPLLASSPRIAKRKKRRSSSGSRPSFSDIVPLQWMHSSTTIKSQNSHILPTPIPRRATGTEIGCHRRRGWLSCTTWIHMDGYGAQVADS